ncbi:MAG: hypothetical protein AAFV88_17095, partial [Planctomycetota bacterium]
QIKPDHAAFMVSHPFVNFVRRQLLTGQPLMITGAASTSGDLARNRNLSRRRANVVRRAIMQMIRKRLPQIARTLRDREHRDDAIRTIVAGQDNAFLTRSGSRIQIPGHDRGMQAALNRRVSIWASVDHAQSRSSIERIGRMVVRSRFPRVPEHFRFWDMWTFSSSTIAQFVPNPIMQADRNWGSRVPQDRNWSGYRPGYRAAGTDPFVATDFKKMEDELVSPQYSKDQVRESVDHFLDRAEAAARSLMNAERQLLNWTRRTGEVGQTSILNELNGYLAFRRAMILEDPSCALKMVGFRPIEFYSRPR